MTKPALLAGLLLLAGCGQPASAPTNTAAAAPAGGEHGYIARVQALNPRQRAAVMFRAIDESGGKGCQRVTEVNDLPAATPGRPGWRVTCSDSSQWTVTLGDDGTAMVTGAASAAPPPGAHGQ